MYSVNVFYCVILSKFIIQLEMLHYMWNNLYVKFMLRPKTSYWLGWIFSPYIFCFFATSLVQNNTLINAQDEVFTKEKS